MSKTFSSLAAQRDSEPLDGDALVGETLTSRDASTVLVGVDIFLRFLEQGGEVGFGKEMRRGLRGLEALGLRIFEWKV